jgi:hypothetical protein
VKHPICSKLYALPGKGLEALERNANKFITQQGTARGVMGLHFTCRSRF